MRKKLVVIFFLLLLFPILKNESRNITTENNENNIAENSITDNQTLELHGKIVRGISDSYETNNFENENSNPLNVPYSSDELYRVAPGDALAYREFYHPADFKQSGMVVTPDGYASFEPLGSIFVAGKTILEIQKILEAKISEYIIEPKVTLTVIRPHAGTAYLAGAVMKPGMVELATYHGNPHDTVVTFGPARLSMRICNILNHSGGVRMNADLENVTVTRAHTGKKLKANLIKVLNGEDSSQDLWINFNDTIFIPFLSIEDQENIKEEQYLMILNSVIGPKEFPVRVEGWVNQPNVYNLPSLSPYLNSAISQAGGFAMGANKKLVAIRRFYNESKYKTIFVDPNKKDTLLYPNDVVYVSELKVYKAGRFFQQVTQILSPFTSLLNSTITPLILLNNGRGR